MRKYFFISFALLISFGSGVIFNQAWAATKKGVVLDKKIAPPGVKVINKNTLSLKPGYKIKILSNHSFTLMKQGVSGGTFDCNCQLSSGGCEIVIAPTSVSCATGSCSSSCYITVTIPTKKLQMLR